MTAAYAPDHAAPAAVRGDLRPGELLEVPPVGEPQAAAEVQLERQDGSVLGGWGLLERKRKG